jgi:hypothetical protein
MERYPQEVRKILRIKTQEVCKFLPAEGRRPLPIAEMKIYDTPEAHRCSPHELPCRGSTVKGLKNIQPAQVLDSEPISGWAPLRMAQYKSGRELEINHRAELAIRLGRVKKFYLSKGVVFRNPRSRAAGRDTCVVSEVKDKEGTLKIQDSSKFDAHLEDCRLLPKDARVLEGHDPAKFKGRAKSSKEPIDGSLGHLRERTKEIINRSLPLFHGKKYSSDSEGDGPGVEKNTFMKVWPLVSLWIKTEQQGEKLIFG